MTRGKYAAKANGQRAEAALNTVGALRRQLDQRDREHAAEVVKLKAEIASLQGKLLREVQALAADRVERIREECRAELAAERADRYKTAKKVAQFLGSNDNARLRLEAWPELAKMLGVDVGELITDWGAGVNRHARRTTASKINETVQLEREGFTPEQIAAGPPGARRRSRMEA